MSSLKQVEGNLNELIKFVQSQQKNLREKELLINKMEAERSKLEPLLKADQETVQALLSFQYEQQRRDVWWDRAIGFFLGILGSLIASFIWAVRKRIRAPAEP